MFDTPPESPQLASVVAFGLLMGAVASPVAPSSYHRIVTKHGAEGSGSAASPGSSTFRSCCWGWRSASISIWSGIKSGRLSGRCSASASLAAFVFRYGIELMHLTKRMRPLSSSDSEESELEDWIDYALTEARVVLPGAQALLGFQLIVISTESFGTLPETSALAHLGALAAIAIPPRC